MSTEEKIDYGMKIYAEYRRKYYADDFFNDFERGYVSGIIEACELNFYDRLIPVREMCLALEYCSRANRMVKIVLDAAYLSGEELEAYCKRYEGNAMRLRGAGKKADVNVGRSYHIEYAERPLMLMSEMMNAFLMH